MRRWWIAPLVLVFSLILTLGVYIIYLSFVNVPKEELRTFVEDGLLIHTDGSTEPCQVVLTGILAEYRLGEKPPFFYTQELASRQGLFLNGKHLIQRLSLGWYKGRGDYITFIKNGTRLFLARDMAFVVMITPDGSGGRQVAAAPAATPDEAVALLKLLGEDPWLRYICPNDCDFLLQIQ